ncbi:hypothetical protein H109_05264, partial [Trichophyton interdigitale MR816]
GGNKWYHEPLSYHNKPGLNPCSSMSSNTQESRGREQERDQAGVMGESQPCQCRKSIARDGPVLLLHMSLNQTPEQEPEPEPDVDIDAA